MRSHLKTTALGLLLASAIAQADAPRPLFPPSLGARPSTGQSVACATSEGKPGFWERIFGGRGNEFSDKAKPVARGLENGSRWPNAIHRMAMSVAADKRFFELMGYTGKNLFGALCPNFLNLKPKQRQNVLAKTAMTLAYAESNFRVGETGDEGRRTKAEGGGDGTLAKGIFQISDNTRRGFGCHGNLVTANPDSLDCVFRIFQARGVVSKHTHWSNLMPGKTAMWKTKKKDKNGNFLYKGVYHPMEQQFMPTFAAQVPECRSTIRPEHRDDRYMPPVSTAWVGNVDRVAGMM
jgi:hypothetical protein